MDSLAAIAELVRVWMDGGDWTKIQATEGFRTLVGVAAWLAPMSLIALGFGVDSWRELPIATFLGFSSKDPKDDPNWAERARDLDKDGIPDI